jgi:hypothetical protein
VIPARRRVVSLVIIFGVITFRWLQSEHIETPDAPQREQRVERPREPRGDQQLEGVGIVSRVLPDDDDGSRHQRFILTLANGRTLLVAHNIDLAPRLTGLDRGDTVAFFGEFESNAEGGVVHWTHRDPAGRHVAGWLRHEGRTVQ